MVAATAKEPSKRETVARNASSGACPSRTLRETRAGMILASVVISGAKRNPSAAISSS